MVQQLLKLGGSQIRATDWYRAKEYLLPVHKETIWFSKKTQNNYFTTL